MKKYKVITQKDKWFSGKFDPVILEQVLNDHAAQGWRVVSMTSASREGLVMGAGKDELVVLLEKDVAAPAAARPMAEASTPGIDGVYRL